jgi:hypothetical protein
MIEGDWRLYAVVEDKTGRTKEVQMKPGGGGSPVTVRLRTNPGADTVAIAPVAGPAGGAVSSFPAIVTLTSSTTGATIQYELRDLGAAATETWTTYSGAISVTGQKSLYARATAEGLTNSPTVREDYSQANYDSPPGWNPSG